MSLPNLIKTKSYRSLSNRFMEIDILRGIAIIGMIYLHVLWDLDYYGVTPINNDIYKFQKIIPALFFVLVGICLIVSRNRKTCLPSFDGKKYDIHLIVRGLKIFSLGMVITTVTLLFITDKPIFFGVLHCIGLCVLFSIPFLKLKTHYTFMAGVAIIVLGLSLNLVPMEDPSVVHLAAGIHQADVAAYTIDYFPLFPWFGLTLIGISLGNILYKDNKRRFPLPDLSKYKPAAVFSWMGKHSLAIYLLHQPIIAGAISLYLLL